MFCAGDSRQSCSPITFLAETLSPPRMNQISKLSRKSSLFGCIVFDDPEILRYFGVLVQIPSFQVGI